MEDNKNDKSVQPIKKEQARTAALKKKLVDAMAKNCCVITYACREAGCSRNTFSQYYNNDPEFKAAIDELNEIDLDESEATLHHHIIKKRDDKSGLIAAIFKLKTKGKKRGYVERLETVDKSKVQDQMDSLSDDELMRMASMEVDAIREILSK